MPWVFAVKAEQNLSVIKQTVQIYRKKLAKYLDLTQKIKELDAEIDAEVFKLYGMSREDAKGILSWLNQDDAYGSMVIQKMMIS